MTNLHNKISVYEKGLCKLKKELRGYRYPSKSYLNCEKRINDLEFVLNKLKSQDVIQRANIQVMLWNKEEIK